MIKYDSSWNRHHLCLILLPEFQDWKGCKFRARGATGRWELVWCSDFFGILSRDIFEILWMVAKSDKPPKG